MERKFKNDRHKGSGRKWENYFEVKEGFVASRISSIWDLNISSASAFVVP